MSDPTNNRFYDAGWQSLGVKSQICPFSLLKGFLGFILGVIADRGSWADEKKQMVYLLSVQ